MTIHRAGPVYSHFSIDEHRAGPVSRLSKMTIHRAGPVYSLVLSIAVIAIALSQYHYFSRTHGLKRWVANNTIMRPSYQNHTSATTLMVR